MPTDGPSGAQVVAQLLAGAPVDMKLVAGVAEPWTSYRGGARVLRRYRKSPLCVR